jgi:hypothetical protein
MEMFYPCILYRLYGKKSIRLSGQSIFHALTLDEVFMDRLRGLIRTTTLLSVGGMEHSGI